MARVVDVLAPPPRECTVGPAATSGARCGRPAVTWFVASGGGVLAECAEHAASGAPTIKQEEG